MRMKQLRKRYKNITFTPYGVRVDDTMYIKVHWIDEVNAMIYTLEKLGLYNGSSDD